MIRQVAEKYNVRWPHDGWCAGFDKAGKVRHKLAHLLYVMKVDDESHSPNRKLAFALGKPGEKRKVDKRPGELNFRDNVWSQQRRLTLTSCVVAGCLDALDGRVAQCSRGAKSPMSSTYLGAW
jgi:hypothetical protein